jgi:hypothetical protein
MSEDGGLDESLNLYIDSAESAPALVPENVTSKLGLPADLQAEKVFVHKTANYEHYLVQQGRKVLAFVEGKSYTLLTLAAGEKMSDIAAVGNIVIVTATESVYYLLWKKNEYVLIGNQLPVPAIQIDVIGNDEETFYGKNGGKVGVDSSGTIPGFMAIAQFDKGAWEEAARGVAENEDVNNAFQQLNNDFWSSVQSLKNKIGKWGYFSCPRFVRYAVKLYDGSYVYHSVPILIGAGEKEWLSATGSSVDVGDKPSGLYYNINLFYKAVAKLITWEVEGWEDIIEGVDIFISTDIAFPAINEDFASCDDGGGKVYFKGHDEAFEKTKEEILSKVLFYKVESVAVRDLDSLKKGIDLHRHDFVEQDEDLVVRERLTSDYMTSHKVIPRTMNLYNNSLLVNAAKIEMPEPYPLLGGLFCNTKLDAVWDKYQTPQAYQMKFHMRRNNGEEYSVMARNPKGGFDLVTPLISNGAPSQLEEHWYARPMAWISYPDVNCYEVEIFLGGGEIMSIPMSQHPGLSVAYAFVGLDVLLEDYAPVGVVHEYDYTEKKTYEQSNQVMMSEMNNPFIFPVAKRNTLQSSILGTAIATSALSQGQFGQFPLYVFTEDGIWAMETAADGSFVTSKPLSRDVCVNPDSITSIDNAVVFVTAKSVMLLQGSQVMDISPYMSGRHYVINRQAEGLISGSDYASLIPAITDDTPFMAFMRKATIAYDYPGKRLICIAADEDYQYVYKMDTQTWHKSKHNGVKPLLPVNSYPECYVQGQGVREIVTRVYLRVTQNNSQEEYEYLVERIRLRLPNLRDEEIDSFLEMEGMIDVTSLEDSDRDWLYDELNELNVVTVFKEREEEIMTTRIYDFSTVLDGSREQKTERGVIVTRPMDLGYADVKKVIKDMRIRGQFESGHVKCILQGSDDGVNFFNTALRQKSWKLFRVIIVCNLDRHERISWMDIDFDIRYNNRLR